MKKYLLVSLSSLIVFCRRHPSEPPLARYKDRYLLRSEALERMSIPAGSDTALLLRAYAVSWLRQQALADTAYRLLPELRTRIEEQVQDYRTKLLIAYLSRMLSERWAQQWKLPDSLLRRHYESQPEAFRAIQPYFQYRWVQQPATAAARVELTRYLTAPDTTWQQWLKERGYSGSIQNTWVARSALDSLQAFFSVPLATLPLRGTAQSLRTVNGQPMLLTFQLTGIILPGQVLPFEIVKEQVKHVVLQDKLHAQLAAFEDSLYQRALASGVGELY